MIQNLTTSDKKIKVVNHKARFFVVFTKEDKLLSICKNI